MKSETPRPGGEAIVGRAGWGSTKRSAVPGTAEETPIRCGPALTIAPRTWQSVLARISHHQNERRPADFC